MTDKTSSPVQLGTLCSKIGSGVTPRGGDSVYISEGVSLIRSQNVYNLEFTSDGLAYIDEKQAEKMDGVTVLENDVLLNITGDSVARCCIVPSSVLPARVNQHVSIIRTDSTKLNPHYLMYYLTSPYAQAYLLSLAGSGGTRKALTKSMIEALKIPLPSLSAQDNIVSVLSAYDDLIENNRRRIDLLEQSARMLYKEWFVSLRFPGHEHVKVKDGVPQGWEISTVADVCNSFEDGDWIESKDQGGEDYRLLQISNIGEDDFVETGNFRYVTEETFRRLRCNEVKPGDILISRMPEPIGRAWYVTEQPWKMITAVDATIARPNPERVNSFYYLYHINSPSHLAACAARATGATRPRVTRKNMGALPIAVPPLNLQNEFSNIASDLHRMKTNLRVQNKQLQQARDLLLPRLMNGEIPV